MGKASPPSRSICDAVISKLRVSHTIGDGDISVTEEGIAFQKVFDPVEYGEDYFNRYQGLRGSSIAECLNRKRASLLSKYASRRNLDIGVGSGEFIERYEADGGSSLGYDVNPFGIAWLRERQRFFDPYRESSPVGFDSATMWDSLEHMPSPSRLLGLLRARLVFVSIPVIADLDALWGWKHFKPNEHLFYFSERGLEFFMQENGFRLLEKNRMEEECGREDIGTFVFQKRDVPLK